MTAIPLPEDFPRGAPMGAVSGVQAKLLARCIDGQYVVGWTEEEFRERYENCEDLVQQLVLYCQRKEREHPDWSREFNLERMATGVGKKANSGEWDITVDELAWIVRENQKNSRLVVTGIHRCRRASRGRQTRRMSLVGVCVDSPSDGTLFVGKMYDSRQICLNFV